MVEQTPPSGIPVVGSPGGSEVAAPLVVAGRTAAEPPAPVTAVPGSPVPVAPALDHPPSYPPRRQLREAAGETRGVRTVPRRTSTTTGTRVGRLTWPLLALLLLLVALLGAALADRLFGAAATSGDAERPAATVVAAGHGPAGAGADLGGYALLPPVPVG